MTSGSRPRKPSSDLLALIAACTLAFVPGMSALAFGIVSTWTPPEPRIFLTPSARCGSPEFEASWITISTFFAPADLNCLPAPWPATSSVWPMCTM